VSTADAVPHHARRRRPDRGWFTRRRAITFSLAVATAGEAIPYGTQGSVTGASGIHLTAEEWTLTGAAFLAAALLIVDLFLSRENAWRRGAWSYALTGMVWLTLGAYDALVPGPTWQWHLGRAMVDVGIALIALHQWRFTAIGREVAR
jgi:VIT1/CCC1 family predicted Fe2+/Mn2+ transporter